MTHRIFIFHYLFFLQSPVLCERILPRKWAEYGFFPVTSMLLLWKFQPDSILRKTISLLWWCRKYEKLLSEMNKRYSFVWGTDICFFCNSYLFVTKMCKYLIQCFAKFWNFYTKSSKTSFFYVKQNLRSKKSSNVILLIIDYCTINFY